MKTLIRLILTVSVIWGSIHIISTFLDTKKDNNVRIELDPTCFKSEPFIKDDILLILYERIDEEGLPSISTVPISVEEERLLKLDQPIYKTAGELDSKTKSAESRNEILILVIIGLDIVLIFAIWGLLPLLGELIMHIDL